MATVIVCDLCSERDARSVFGRDLCGECALGILSELPPHVVSQALGRKLPHGPVGLEDQAEPPPTPPPFPLPLDDDVVAQQRRTQLAFTHMADIFYLRLPELKATLPTTVEHGGVKWLVLEACKSKHGNYLAKGAS